ncbi:hypothetical protein BB558_004423 [Smittium angustum]|uniref:Xaa-Pro aminopeptidase P n=1 Tax=Smittium angustum TaxID=133377 RepID=A0A2U1J3G6_SMIAN|nr:hypothetical protein BB558_004423 [Smittium angustum]
MSDSTAANPVNTTDRVSALRKLMQDPKYNLDAYIIPSEDAHQSEYVAACDKRREFISGFSGSAGTAIVTNSAAYLFTDGRYHAQASIELDENWTLMRVGVPDVPTVPKFLAELPGGSTVGIDPSLLSVNEADNYTKILEEKGSKIVGVKDNLVDAVWENKPSMPKESIFYLDIKFSGKSWIDKVSQVRKEAEKLGASGVLVAALDQIAWLFNLRGNDIMYNPLFFSYSLITKDKVSLFVDSSKLTKEALESLNGVEILPYNAIFSALESESASLAESKSKLITDSSVSWALINTLGEQNCLKKMSPITHLKAIKNETELNGTRQCHIRDGVAMAKWYGWLEHELIFNGGHLKLSECDVADKLESLRREQENCVGLSFDTISSVGPNGAIIHYSPSRGSDLKLDINQIYLVDSGGQYYDGTTDVTRTWHFGTPTAWERECFTRVLKGHIGLDSIVFPEGTNGYALDTMARASLWNAGLDYRHGTGHGIGSFLNVHEGPHGISFRPGSLDNPLKAGMLVTNEPGYYEEGKFGIRIENTCEVVYHKTPNNFGGMKFLKLEPVTLCPIQTKLIVVSLLTHEEVEWVNNYHKRVWDTLSPLLEKGSPAYNWLDRNTSPI